MKPWRVLASRSLLVRRWLEIHEQRIELPHGGVIDEFHLITAPDWVGVLALTEQGEIVCVEQYRHGAGRPSLELPAGVIDAGETAIDAARRELREETGYAAESFEPLLSASTEPSRHTNRAHFFFAKGVRRAHEQELDASENIRVRLVSVGELLDTIERGEWVHGIHVGPILLARRRGWI